MPAAGSLAWPDLAQLSALMKQSAVACSTRRGVALTPKCFFFLLLGAVFSYSTNCILPAR